MTMARCLCATAVTGVALVVAACGGSGSTTAETTASVTEPAPTTSKPANAPTNSTREEEQKAQQVLAEEEARTRRQKSRAKRRAAKRRAQEQAESGIAPLTRQLHNQWSGIEQENFQLAYETCGSQPQAQSAREWETANNPSAITHAFGREYKEFTRAAVEEGCLRALADSHAQWEAELEAFGQL